MTAHESRVLVAERNVKRDARPATLFRGGDQRRALAQRLAHGRAEFGMEDRRGVFEFAVLTNSSRLAVALDLAALDAERSDRLLRQQGPERLADIGEFRQVFHIASRRRIGDDGDRRRAACRRQDITSHFRTGFLDDRHNLANVRRHVRSSRSCDGLPSIARRQAIALQDVRSRASRRAVVSRPR